MDRLTDELMGRPSLVGERCAVCGRPATNAHHVVMKGAGGVSRETDARIPRISLCGMGNCSGCHGLAHSRRLHFRWRGRWEWLYTPEPVKYQEALVMEGWRKSWME
ncbi:MAG: hypothetical protein ACOYEF_02680 [Planifilum sp.]